MASRRWNLFPPGGAVLCFLGSVTVTQESTERVVIALPNTMPSRTLYLSMEDMYVYKFICGPFKIAHYFFLLNTFNTTDNVTTLSVVILKSKYIKTFSKDESCVI